MGLFDQKAPGDPLKIEAEDFNNWQAAARLARESTYTTGSARPDFTDYLTIAHVRNDSGTDLDRGEVLGLNGPLVTPTADLSEFITAPTFAGILPIAGTHENKFCILIEPIGNGSIGMAAVAGVVRAQIEGADVGFAEIQNGSSILQASATGSARVLWADSGSGQRWALVRLGSGVGTTNKARWINFSLPSPLLNTDDHLDNCPVTYSWDGPAPASHVTVYNQTASAGVFMFSGAAGKYGLASYDPANNRYLIIQLEC